MRTSKIVNGVFIYLHNDKIGGHVRTYEFNYLLNKFELVSSYVSLYYEDCVREFKTCVY